MTTADEVERRGFTRLPEPPACGHKSRRLASHRAEGLKPSTTSTHSQACAPLPHNITASALHPQPLRRLDPTAAATAPQCDSPHPNPSSRPASPAAPAKRPTAVAVEAPECCLGEPTCGKGGVQQHSRRRGSSSCCAPVGGSNPSVTLEGRMMCTFGGERASQVVCGIGADAGAAPLGREQDGVAADGPPRHTDAGMGASGFHTETVSGSQGPRAYACAEAVGGLGLRSGGLAGDGPTRRTDAGVEVSGAAAHAQNENLAGGPRPGSLAGGARKQEISDATITSVPAQAPRAGGRAGRERGSCGLAKDGPTWESGPSSLSKHGPTCEHGICGPAKEGPTCERGSCGLAKDGPMCGADRTVPRSRETSADAGGPQSAHGASGAAASTSAGQLTVPAGNRPKSELRNLRSASANAARGALRRASLRRACVSTWRTPASGPRANLGVKTQAKTGSGLAAAARRSTGGPRAKALPLRRPAVKTAAQPRRTRGRVHRTAGACNQCGVKTTLNWRKGPPETPHLCNACGMCWKRTRTLKCVLCSVL
jgi:hypothetical protein